MTAHPGHQTASAHGHDWGYIVIPEQYAAVAVVIICVVVCAWFAWTMHLCLLLQKFEGKQ